MLAHGKSSGERGEGQNSLWIALIFPVKWDQGHLLLGPRRRPGRWYQGAGRGQQS